MRRVFMCAAAVLLAVSAGPEAHGETEMSDLERAGYSIGVQFSRMLSGGEALYDADALTQGLVDGLGGSELKLSDEDIQAALMSFQQSLSAAQQEASTVDGEKFLTENAKKDGIVTLPSGLQYKILEAGSGAKPAASDTVRTHYHGTLIDGTVFDSSYDRGTPAEFPVNRVIPGWTEALQLMPVGSKWELYIPSNLAYGARAAGQIPPHSTLVFQVELLEIMK